MHLRWILSSSSSLSSLLAVDDPIGLKSSSPALSSSSCGRFDEDLRKQSVRTTWFSPYIKHPSGNNS